MVVLSRWLPLMPEVVACLAGLSGMPFRRFLVALACGSVPLGFAFAAIGATGREAPWVALAVSAGLPPVLWALVRPGFLPRSRARSGENVLEVDDLFPEGVNDRVERDVFGVVKAVDEIAEDRLNPVTDGAGELLVF